MIWCIEHVQEDQLSPKFRNHWHCQWHLPSRNCTGKNALLWDNIPFNPANPVSIWVARKEVQYCIPPPNLVGLNLKLRCLVLLRKIKMPYHWTARTQSAKSEKKYVTSIFHLSQELSFRDL